MTENERRHSERQRRICHRGGEKRKISSKWQIYHAGACNHYSWSGIYDLRNLAWCIIYVFYLMLDMGCNVINFSSRINEEIKLKNKKIFIGVYKTWMRYAAWFAETWCIMKRLENMYLLIIKSNTAMRNWYVHSVVGCRIIETIMYRNHTIRF